MPARPLVLFPDPRLALRATSIHEFERALNTLADDLRDTLLAVNAIGLTAPHIGVSARMAVIRMTPDEKPRVFANPTILWASSDTVTHDEGSVSMPGVRERITRPACIRFGYSDLEGVAHEEEAEGFPAAVVQHEIDQLDGVFWISRLSRLKRDRIVKRFGKVHPTSDAS